MSYFRDLDEFEDWELNAELARRKTDRLNGYCDYCHRKPDDTRSCKFPHRHKRAALAELTRLGEAQENSAMYCEHANECPAVCPCSREPDSSNPVVLK